MKTIKYITFLAVGVSLVSCEDLDTEPQGATLTQTQKETVYNLDPSKGEASINSLFTAMKTYEPNYDAIGSAHSDFGYGSIMLYTDANADDMPAEVTGYNWFSSEIEYTDRTVSNYRNQIIWNDLYSYIRAANAVLTTQDQNSDDSDTQFAVANAKGMRAFSYFLLAQLYQFNYVGHEQSPCVPIITEENAEAVATEGAPRATVKEVYDLILSDLNSAVELLTASKKERSDKRYIDLAVAYGLRARVNLTIQKYDDAAADADAAIKSTEATPATIGEVSAPTFSDSEEGNWMWGIIVDETDDVVKSEIVNWISHIGSLNYGYAEYAGGKQISTKLFNSIPETDVRKGWWLNDTCYSANLSRAQAQFVAAVGFAPYTSVKFAPYKNEIETSTNANDVPLMRVEEMYLIKAEAEARAGKGGLATLTDFVKTYRDPEYSFTGTNVAGEVLRQKRIELWGEGLIWYDIMRLGLGIDRRGAGYAPAYVFVIAGDDPILVWPIPEAEIEANKKISTSDQNPLGKTPQPETDLDIPYVVD